VGGARGGQTQPQQLIVVTATYRKATRNDQLKIIATKMSGSVGTLSYGDREGYIKGLADILSRPTLTMQMEFQRDIQWGISGTNT
jgi:hypothetical protein